jgi:hypothetical protein
MKLSESKGERHPRHDYRIGHKTDQQLSVFLLTLYGGIVLSSRFIMICAFKL